MSERHGAPRSFPVSVSDMPERRRAVFSRGVVGLQANRVGSGDDDDLQSSKRYRRRDNDGLRLIDDLTNRPIDPLFSDALLTQQRPRSKVTVFFAQLTVFLMCIAVGLIGVIFVRQLHTDPRKQVRESLISELQQQNASFDKLNAEVSAMHADVVKKTRDAPGDADDPTLNQDEMTNGMLPVKGPGVIITIADPAAANEGQGFNPREKATGRMKRVVTDADLQYVVRTLWRNGAEAISVNGNRIGVSTSVRTAGQTILIGVNQVTSPYKIEAIGDPKDLKEAFDAQESTQFYRDLRNAGIRPQVRRSAGIKLAAAESQNLTYAKETKEEE